jgi:hypothetical protein
MVVLYRVEPRYNSDVFHPSKRMDGDWKQKRRNSDSVGILYFGGKYEELKATCSHHKHTPV